MFPIVGAVGWTSLVRGVVTCSVGPEIRVEGQIAPQVRAWTAVPYALAAQSWCARQGWIVKTYDLRRHLAVRLLRLTESALVRMGRRGVDTGRLFQGLVALHSALDGSFFWEQRAVVLARLRHADSCDTLLYSFRRCIHRIEKGLATRPRRDTFAADYIEQTVRTLGELVDASRAGRDDFASDIGWAIRALSEYFAVATGSERIDRARAAFDGLMARSPITRDVGESTIFPETPVYGFGIEDLLHLARTRHSVRYYQDRPVPRVVVDSAISVALESPSACNRQAFTFRVFDEPELVHKVAEIPIGVDDAKHAIPCLVVLVGNLGAYPASRDRHLIYIDASLAAMAFVLALQVQGIASCCVNWPDIPILEARMQSLLGLAPTERPIMLVTAGYADPEGRAPSSAKRPLDQMRLYNVVADARLGKR